MHTPRLLFALTDFSFVCRIALTFSNETRPSLLQIILLSAYIKGDVDATIFDLFLFHSLAWRDCHILILSNLSHWLVQHKYHTSRHVEL